MEGTETHMPGNRHMHIHMVSCSTHEHTQAQVDNCAHKHTPMCLALRLPGQSRPLAQNHRLPLSLLAPKALGAGPGEKGSWGGEGGFAPAHRPVTQTKARDCHRGRQCSPLTSCTNCMLGRPCAGSWGTTRPRIDKVLVFWRLMIHSIILDSSRI